MATSSKWLQLNDQILLEYIYLDPTDPEVHETANNSAGDFPIEIMSNGYTGTNFMFNVDSVIADSGNGRNRSAIPINANRTKWVWLTTSIPLSYNDFDSELTVTGSLLQSFSPDLLIKYDTIRIHFISAFNYENYDGFIFEIKTARRDSKLVNLMSLLFRKTDSYQTLNPNPFIVGERLYTSYIEVKIPALKYLNVELSGAPTNSNLLGYKLNDGLGYIDSFGIDFVAHGIYKTVKTNSFSYYDTQQIASASFTKSDNFSLLVAHIAESINGDYYEFYGEYDGDIFEDFILELNNQPDSNYLVFHEIVITEQLENSFSETDRKTTIQNDSFDKINTFRPVILNSAHAVSYIIEYTLRLINKVDNSQIIKKSQLISTDVKKYGRKMQKLNMGLVPTVAKIYNKIVDDGEKNIIIVNPAKGDKELMPSIQIVTEFVNVFRDRINIKVSSSPVNIQPNNE
jgi:hypothetical protein